LPSSSYQRLISEIHFLFEDFADNNPQLALRGYVGALWSKLDAAGYFHEKCQEIVRRLPEVICKEEQLEEGPLSINESLVAEAQTYLECFFYFTTSALDILAKLVREFYPKNKGTIGKRYFKQTIDFFTTIDTKLDPSFTRILSANQNWILNIYHNRDAWAHADAAFILFADEEGSVVFDHKGREGSSLKGLPAYLDGVITHLEDFLSLILVHFRAIISEPNTKNC
jgi:hypothetical protein